MGRRISADRVAFVPAAHAEALDLEVAPTGEYRVVEGEPGSQELTDTVAVWIDEAPDDPEDDAGHFEEWSGDGEYQPSPQPPSAEEPSSPPPDFPPGP